MQSIPRLTLALVVLLLAAPAISQPPPREVNVTAGSPPGWAPTVEQEKQALEAALNYLTARDEGRYADAYGMLTQAMKSHLPEDQHAAEARRFNALAGAPLDRRIIKVTWTKDPAGGPFPGAYAAIDVTATYANVDRHCGYVIAYQAPDAGKFLIMRTQEAYVVNAAFDDATEDGQDVDAIWRQVSRACPNYSSDPK
jgi:hypothetical protein